MSYSVQLKKLSVLIFVKSFTFFTLAIEFAYFKLGVIAVVEFLLTNFKSETVVIIYQ